jgi:cell division protein FtsZ
MARTGTDDAVGAPVNFGQEPEPSPATGNYQDYDRPAIWRQPAKSEAAARVIALEEGGMDRFDIPAFLRKQAD